MEMTNPYSQFNIRLRASTRFPAVQTSAADNCLNNLNVHNPFLGTAPLQSPAVAQDCYRLSAGNALYSRMPVTPLTETEDFGSVVQPTFDHHRPRFMMHCNSGMTVPPVVPMQLGNQPFGPYQPRVFPDAAGIRMCSNMQTNEFMQQYMARYAAMLQSHIPVLQPQAASVQQMYNMPAYPGVPVVNNYLNNSADMLSGNADIPFREVQWMPPGGQETGGPQVPYAIDIKPDVRETPQNVAPVSNAPVISGTYAETGANCKTECSNRESAPVVYLDIAMDGGRQCAGANRRTAAMPPVNSAAGAVKATGKTGKRKSNNRRRRSAAKVLKLPNTSQAKAALKPCRVSLVPVVVSSIARSESNSSVEEICVADSPELNQRDGVADRVPETWQLTDSRDTPIPVSSYVSPVPEVQQLGNSGDMLIPVTHDVHPLSEVQEFGNSGDMPIPVTHDVNPMSEIQDCESSGDIPVPVIEENVSDDDLDQLIASDEDVAAEDFPSDDDDNDDDWVPNEGDICSSESNADEQEFGAMDRMELNELGVVTNPVPEVSQLANSEDTPIPETVGVSTVLKIRELGNEEDILITVNRESANDNDSDHLIGSDEEVGAEDHPRDNDICVPPAEEAEAVSDEAACYEVMPNNSDGLLFDMECDGEIADETLRVMLPTKNLKTTGEETGSTRNAVPSPTTNTSQSEQLHKVPTASRSHVSPSVTDTCSSDDVIIVESEASSKTSIASRMLQSLAAKMGSMRKTVPLPTTGEKKRLMEKTLPLPPKTCASSQRLHNVPLLSKTGVLSQPLPRVTFLPRARESAPFLKATVSSDQKILMSLLFDKEFNFDKADRKLRALLPAKNSKVAAETTRSATQSAVLPPNTSKSKQLHKVPTASHSSISPVVTDTHNADDVVIVESVASSNTAVMSRSQQSSAASACREATTSQHRLANVLLKKNENCLVGIPHQSSFFRFESHSSEVFRLLSTEKRFVPHSVLTFFMDLVASVGAVDQYCSNSDALRGTVGRIPRGGSRTLLFQCLFCPYSEMSAKRIMTHVKEQHKNYCSFIQRSLLPIRQFLLHIYCRHCNFVAYDAAAMFVHFAIYHKVPGILLPEPKVIENDPGWAPVTDPGACAKEFPFYRCPDCRYVDTEWFRIIQHVLKEHSFESVFLDCIVRLVMVSRPSKHTNFCTYDRLARLEKHSAARKEIYACVNCRFFSFYPSYAFCHYVLCHSSVEMLFLCAASPCCWRRYIFVEDLIAHIQNVHMTQKCVQCQCTATLLHGPTLTQLPIRPGELVAADVPVRVNNRSLSASGGNGSAVAIAIDDDEGDDSSDDIVVLSPANKDSQPDDVEPDSVSSEKCIDFVDISGDGELSPESATVACDVEGTNESCYSNDHGSEKMAELRREESSESDVVHIDEDETSPVNTGGAMDSVCSSEDQHATVSMEKNNVASNVLARSADLVPSSADANDNQCSDSETSNGTVSKTLAVTAGDATNGMIDSLCGSEDHRVTELVDEQNGEADLRGHVEAETSEIIADDLQHETSRQQPNRTESQSVHNAGYPCASGTSQTESVDPAVDYVLPSCDLNTPADSGTVDDLADHASVLSSDVGTVELEPVWNPDLETSHSELVDSAVDATFSSKDVMQLIDSATDVADSVNHRGLPPNDQGSTESELVQNPVPGAGQTESLDSAEDTTFASNDTSPLTDSAAVVSSLIHHGSVSRTDESATRLAVHQTDDLLELERVHDCPVDEGEVTNPQSDSVCTAEQELLSFDQADSLELPNDCLDFVDNMLSTFELPGSPSDRLESSERCMLDLEDDLLSLSEQLTTDELQSQTGERTDTINEQCNGSGNTDKPVSASRLRFKALASFRVPASSSFFTKPS